jgi:hypothetical protein
MGPSDCLIPLGVGFVLLPIELVFFYSKLFWNCHVFWTLLGFLLQVNVGVLVISRPSPSINKRNREIAQQRIEKSHRGFSHLAVALHIVEN